MFEMHPAAQENINEKAEELRLLLKELPKRDEVPQSFSTEIVTTAIHQKDMIGDMSESRSDYKGRITGRYFHLHGARFGIEGDD